MERVLSKEYIFELLDAAIGTGSIESMKVDYKSEPISMSYNDDVGIVFEIDEKQTITIIVKKRVVV